MGLVDAARSGDRRRTLEELRDVLAASLLDAEVDKRAPLANQLIVVLRELDGLPVGVEVSKVDEISRRRALRRADANVRADTAGKVVGGRGGSRARS